MHLDTIYKLYEDTATIANDSSGKYNSEASHSNKRNTEKGEWLGNQLFNQCYSLFYILTHICVFLSSPHSFFQNLLFGVPPCCPDSGLL